MEKNPGKKQRKTTKNGKDPGKKQEKIKKIKTSKRREIQGKHMKDTKNERERGTSEKRKYRKKSRIIQEKIQKNSENPK